MHNPKQTDLNKSEKDSGISFIPLGKELFPSIKKVFGAEGILSKIWPDFEYRKSQEEMALRVERSLENGEKVILEAGTGVGKSLAYLYPLLKVAAKQGKQVAVSTATKALQNQLVQKDIPVIEKIIDEHILSEVCLGAGNFLCIRRMEESLDINSFGRGMGDVASKALYKWTQDTKTGIKSDYPRKMTVPAWGVMNRESDSCFARFCPNYSKSFYFKAKERWSAAHLLILNHHLLAHHILSEGKLLPEFDSVVVDEAHNFPDIMLSVLTISLSDETAEKLLKPMSRLAKKKKEDSFLSSIDDKSAKILISQSKKYLSSVAAAFSELDALIPLFSKGDFKLDGQPDIHFDVNTEFKKIISVLHKKLEDENLSKELALEGKIIKERFEEFHINFNSFLKQKQKSWTYWLEKGETRLLLKMGPVEYKELLSYDVLQEFTSIIFTSATISVAGSADYFIHQIAGLAKDIQFYASPFNYRENAILYLPRNMAHPSKQTEQFSADVNKILPYLLELTKGNSLILFTSKKMLEESLEILVETQSDKYTFISQMEWGAENAYKQFLLEKNSVLLGLNSFWEGVDVKGDKLRQVIIIKLPFQVPDSPVLKSRIERSRKAGGNPFMEIQVPAAVLHFKQGFGRLIRSCSDTGIVSVLDSRIRGQHYGKFFTSSIPETKVALSYGELKKHWKDIEDGLE